MTADLEMTAAPEAVNADVSGVQRANGSAQDSQHEAAGSDDTDEARKKALAAIAALKNKVEEKKGADQDHGAAASNAAAQAPARPLKKRFGPPANAPRQAPKKQRTRRSRWETEPSSDSKALIINSGPLWPTDVTLPGGITVCPCSGRVLAKTTCVCLPAGAYIIELMHCPRHQ